MGNICDCGGCNLTSGIPTKKKMTALREAIMKLTPLKQWICDSCGGIIEKPKDGWWEYIHDMKSDLISWL